MTSSANNTIAQDSARSVLRVTVLIALAGLGVLLVGIARDLSLVSKPMESLVQLLCLLSILTPIIRSALTIAQPRALRRLVIAGFALLVLNGTISLCGKLRPLEQMPLVGGNSTYRHTIQDACTIAAFCCFLIAVHCGFEATRKTNRQLKHSELRFRQLFDEAPDAIFVEDFDGSVLDVNAAACRLHRMTRQELIGKHVLDLVPDSERQEVARRMLLFASGEMSEAEGCGLTKDGVRVPLHIRASRIEYRDRPALLLHVSDVSERQHTEEELRRAKEQAESASQAKSAFLANMSHELRTPLNAIIGFADLLLNPEGGPLNTSQHEYVQTISRSGEYLLALINDVLDLARIEAGHHSLRLTRFSLTELLRTSLETVHALARPHGIEMSAEIDEVGAIVADERKVKQIIYNLLANACKFTPQKGRVGIRASRSDAEVTVTVWDTGIGIAEEDQHRIFGEFEQAGVTCTRRFEGTGLGLSLSKHLVEMHGGRIWVDSEPGSGSQFSFTLPHRELAVDEQSADELAEDTPTRIPTGMSVLIIEDEQVNRNLVRETLTFAGFRVLEADGGVSGLEMAKRKPPDAILLDIRLPDKNGLEVLHELRADPNTAQIPVIALTACAMKGDAETFLQAGCVGYISKPIDVGHFATDVYKILDYGSVYPKGAEVSFVPPPPAVPAIETETPEAPDVPAATTAPDRQALPPIEGNKILLVDDDEAVSFLSGQVLRDRGFEVMSTVRGRQAVDLYRQHANEIQAVLLDASMPDMSGEEVCRHIREIRADARVLLVSGREEQELAARFAGQELPPLLQKPYRPAELVARLQELLGG